MDNTVGSARFQSMGGGILNNDSVLTSNIDSVFTLNLNNGQISDLTGIEAFNQLRNLNVNFNQISSIDVSNNIYLRELKN